MQKKISVIIFVLVFVIFTCSCEDQARKADDSIYFLNSLPQQAKVFKKIEKEYKEDTGIEIKIVSKPLEEYEKTLEKEITKEAGPTIFQINGAEGYEKYKNHCSDLSKTTFYKNLSNVDLALYEGELVQAVPFGVEGFGIIYNSEIIEKYLKMEDRKTPLKIIEQIKEFSQLEDIVVDMQKRKDELGIDGVFATTSFDDSEKWSVQMQLANIPVFYEYNEKIKEKTALMAGVNMDEVDFDRNVNIKKLLDLILENSVTEKKDLGKATLKDSISEFALGRCAMIVGGDWLWHYIDEIPERKIEKKHVKMFPAYMGFYGEESQGISIGTESYLAVNTNVSKAKTTAAMDFLNWLFTSEKGKDYVVFKLGYTAPYNTFDPSEIPEIPLGREVVTWLKAGERTVPWVFQSKSATKLNPILGENLLKYSTGEADWAEAMKDVKKFFESNQNKKDS